MTQNKQPLSIVAVLRRKLNIAGAKLNRLTLENIKLKNVLKGKKDQRLHDKINSQFETIRKLEKIISEALKHEGTDHLSHDVALILWQAFELGGEEMVICRMSPDDRFLQHVKNELVKARSKFPDNKHQLTAFNEEAGELNKAMLEHEYGEETAENTYKEAVQSAAMAVRVAVEGDSTFSYSCPQFMARSVEKTEING